ncbi:probable splicing factor, arginine/serine-rich 7 isoform X3 [Hydractinia symbiolongicarpus]|uniref:probable splicing factor, arginine/serine-rich 7 isoform X3 n=1 Tax=Hydractinia symbiolongicarpus TaxID=13093 RepID=UPI00254C817D|nr:probable splicing factor, arginine/serine-rich 7 isoform X3 [Hydractinia symbiolongicarpus]
MKVYHDSLEKYNCMMNEEITATEETINQKEESVLVNGSATKDENASKDIVFTGKVVQVTNVSPGATVEQMATLFGFLGTVTDIRLYPLDDTLPVAVKLCYIKYENSEQCGVAQHLTNTVFIDKALIVVPLNQEEIPEEVECQHLLNTTNAYAQMTANGYLSQAFPVEDVPTNIPGLPPPPVITCTTDPMELEEIKRTIFVENIHDSITSEQLMAFFSGVGEVKYMRLCKSEEQKYAFIEFSMVESVPTALQYNGVLFGNRSLKVTHAKSPVVKPESERIATGRSTIRTMRDVVKRPTFDRETRSSLFDVKSIPNDSTGNYRSPTRRRSRSRTRRSRSRSRSRRRKSRSRSPKRRRSRTRSPVRRRRSYSSAALDKTKTGSPRRRSRRSRSPSRSRSPRRSSRRSRSRSRSRSPKRRKSRSRSRDRRKKRKSVSKSSSRSPRRRSRKKSKSRSRSPARRKSRKSTSKSPDRSSSKKKKKEKDREREKKEGKSKKKEEGDVKEKNKDKEAEADDQELNSLLTKIYTFEEEKKSEAKKSKDKESSDESSQKLKKKESL